jgi:hypothetical protein
MLESVIEALAQVEAWIVALLPVALLTYFVPVLIAYARRHQFVLAIGALNFIIGWTGLGWLAILLWALNRDVREYAEPRPTRNRQQDIPVMAVPARQREPRFDMGQAPPSFAPAEYRKCPECMQPVLVEATMCRSCGHDLRKAASGAASVRPVAPVRELDRREPRAFPDSRRPAAPARPIDEPPPPRQLKPGRMSGRPAAHGDDSEWLYDVPGMGERRH